MHDIKMEDPLIVGITGISGTLGKRLAEILQQKGMKVIGLVRAESLAKANLDYELVTGSVTDKAAVELLVSKVDVIVHLAAHVGHGSKTQYHNVNVGGIENICKAIREHKPSCKLINCSSIASLRIPSLFTPAASIYARSKAKADKVVRRYRSRHKLDISTVYPGLIYGPGDTKFIPKVIEYLDKGHLFYVSGGEKNAPLIYIDDLCKLFYLAIKNPYSGGKRYIGINDDQRGIHHFLDRVASKAQCKRPTRKFNKSIIMPLAITLEMLYSLLRIQKSPPLSRRIVDILSINFPNDIRADNRLLQWEADMPVEDGLDNFFKWWKEQPPASTNTNNSA